MAVSNTGGSGGNGIDIDDAYHTEWRWRRVWVSAQFIIEGLKTSHMLFESSTYRVIKNALPQDAKFIRAHEDIKTGGFYLIVESSTFDALSDGAEIPLHPPIVIEQV